MSNGELHRLIVQECERAGGPTDKCLQIYSAIRLHYDRFKRRHYWDAVNEGITKYRRRNRS